MEEWENKIDYNHSVGTKVADIKVLKELGIGLSGVVYSVKSKKRWSSICNEENRIE